MCIAVLVGVGGFLVKLFLFGFCLFAWWLVGLGLLSIQSCGVRWCCLVCVWVLHRCGLWV